MATLNPTPAVTKDVLNALTEKCAHLEALMHMTFGEAGESFGRLADELRDNYLWHCSQVVGEIKLLADALSPAAVQTN